MGFLRVQAEIEVDVMMLRVGLLFLGIQVLVEVALYPSWMPRVTLEIIYGFKQGVLT